jgi:hypothetical protein
MRYTAFLLIIWLVCNSLSCRGQVDNQILKQNIKNDKIITLRIMTIDKEPLSHASVTYLNSNIGTLSDKNGFAKLPYKSDSICVSYVGYKSIKKLVVFTEDTIDLFLRSDIRDLEPVAVYNRQFTNRKINYSSDIKNDGYIKVGFGSQIGFMLSEFRNIQNGKILSLSLPILKTNYSSEIRMQIIQYDEQINNRKEILFDTILLISKGVKSITMDLSEFNVFIEGNKILLSITNLGKPGFKEGEYLKYRGQNVEPFYRLTSKFLQKITYINYLDREWSLYPILNSPNGQPSITNLCLEMSLIPYR